MIKDWAGHFGVGVCSCEGMTYSSGIGISRARQARLTLMLTIIVVPSFKYGKYLPDALASVCTLTHRPIELIVADDSSVDDSRQIVAPFGKLDGAAEIECSFREENKGKFAVLSSGTILRMLIDPSDPRVNANLRQAHLDLKTVGISGVLRCRT